MSFGRMKVQESVNLSACARLRSRYEMQRRPISISERSPTLGVLLDAPISGSFKCKPDYGCTSRNCTEGQSTKHKNILNCQHGARDYCACHPPQCLDNSAGKASNKD